MTIEPDAFARSAYGDDDPDGIDRLVDALDELGAKGLSAVTVLPTALTLARECRAVLDLDKHGKVTTTVVTPSPHRPHELYTAALADTAGDDTRAGELYRHALVEAGMIVDDQHRPVDPCPVCGWRAP